MTVPGYAKLYVKNFFILPFNCYIYITAKMISKYISISGSDSVFEGVNFTNKIPNFGD